MMRPMGQIMLQVTASKRKTAAPAKMDRMTMMLPVLREEIGRAHV